MSDTELEQIETVLIRLTESLLTSISNGDWTTYTRLCAADLTAFEPEGRGNLIRGLDFHKYYFDLPAEGPARPTNITLSNPHVRVMGHVAVVSYVRLIQNGGETTAFEETRVWQKLESGWVHVHFHRSDPGGQA